VAQCYLSGIKDATQGKGRVRKEALDWLLDPNEDFNLVCELADLESYRLRLGLTLRLCQLTEEQRKQLANEAAAHAAALDCLAALRDLAA
jgi:hypothetical protein